MCQIPSPWLRCGTRVWYRKDVADVDSATNIGGTSAGQVTKRVTDAAAWLPFSPSTQLGSLRGWYSLFGLSRGRERARSVRRQVQRGGAGCQLKYMNFDSLPVVSDTGCLQKCVCVLRGCNE